MKRRLRDPAQADPGGNNMNDLSSDPKHTFLRFEPGETEADWELEE